MKSSILIVLVLIQLSWSAAFTHTQSSDYMWETGMGLTAFGLNGTLSFMEYEDFFVYGGSLSGYIEIEGADGTIPGIEFHSRALYLNTLVGTYINHGNHWLYAISGIGIVTGRKATGDNPWEPIFEKYTALTIPLYLKYLYPVKFGAIGVELGGHLNPEISMPFFNVVIAIR
ncbi:MAG: hypothetical protein OCD01_12560 [Fibrobacterales bacterium]